MDIIKIKEMKELINNRFTHKPWNYLLDCAEPDGTAFIPTPEECNKGIPNVLGWTTNNENGAFFTGLYLYALCDAYECEPKAELKSEIVNYTNGLLRLCDVCKNDGCIARGVSDDGISHYPFSSEDQACPFILGLWRMLHSDASDNQLKSEVTARLKRTLKGIREAGWKVPTEWVGVTRGDCSRNDWRGCAKLIFCAKISEELGIIDIKEFENLRNEYPKNSPYTRYEIVSHGFSPDMIRNSELIQFWIDMCAHLCVFEMKNLDKKYSDYYEMGIRNNGYSSYRFFDDFKKYTNSTAPGYCFDWRTVNNNKLTKVWDDPDEAVRTAGIQVGEFNKICKRRHMEHVVLGQCLFAIWIALASDDKKTSEYAQKKLMEAIDYIKWETMACSYVFVAISAYYFSKKKIYKNITCDK